MNKINFSVIIPTLNEEKFLPNLLTSLAIQTKRNFEVIVVDGQSTDDTVRVAGSFAKKIPNLKVVQSERPSLPLQRNVGAQQARGEWFVFIDADSVVMPYFLERLERFIQERNPQVFTTWFSPDSNVGGDAMIALLTNAAMEGAVMFHRPVAPGPLAIVNRKAHEAVGGYNLEYQFGEDAEYGRRLAENGFPLEVLRETLVICSLRRFRREGTIRVLQTYAKAAVTFLVTKRPPRKVTGYIMGGALYNEAERKSLRKRMVAIYEARLHQLKKLMHELSV